MRAVLVPPRGKPEAIELPEGDDGKHLDALQAAVGGMIEVLDLGRDDATAFGHEEAKIVNRQVCDSCGRDWESVGSAGGRELCKHCGSFLPGWVEGLEFNQRATDLVYGPGGAEARQQRKQHTLDKYREAGWEIIDASPLVEIHDEAGSSIGTDPREPYVAGPIVVLGFNPRSGESLPIPDDLASELLAPERIG